MNNPAPEYATDNGHSSKVTNAAKSVTDSVRNYHLIEVEKNVTNASLTNLHNTKRARTFFSHLEVVELRIVSLLH